METPKLLDFGISKFVDTQEALGLTGGGSILGTPMYMSPEQATKSRGIDARSDQYSLGVILYECACVEDPFKGETLYDVLQAIVAGDFPPPSAYHPELPAAFEAIILRAMSTEPEFRFPDLPTMGRALLQFADARDSAIWTPAFEPARATGAPLNPSIPPQQAPSMPPLPLTKPKQPQSANTTTLSDAASEIDSEPRLPVRRGLPWTIAVGAVLLLGVGGIVWFEPPILELFDKPKPIPSRGNEKPNAVQPAVTAPDRKVSKPIATYRVVIRTEPGSAKLELDGNPVGTSSLALELPRDGTTHLLRVSAEGYQTREVTFRDEPPPESIELTATAARGKRVVKRGGGIGKRRAEPSAVRGPGPPPIPPVTSRPGIERSTPPAAPRYPPAVPRPTAPPPEKPKPPTIEFSKNKAPIID
jgi:serine/threonine-protein kinase